MPLLTPEQRVVALQYIPRVPAALSIVGSSVILIAVGTRRGLRREPYHRMMFCLSVYDLVGALWTVVGSLPVPEEYGIPGSQGNTRVCSLQGFFIHWSTIATNIYNAAVVLYFLLKIRYNVKDTDIGRCFEPLVHAVALTVSLGLALTGQFLEVFNPIGFGGPSNSPLCYIQAFPPGCDFVPGMQCERGANAGTVIWFIAIGPFIIATLTLLVSLGLVLLTVIVKARQSKRFDFRYTIHKQSSCSSLSRLADEVDVYESTRATSFPAETGDASNITSSATAATKSASKVVESDESGNTSASFADKSELTIGASNTSNEVTVQSRARLPRSNIEKEIDQSWLDETHHSSTGDPPKSTTTPSLKRTGTDSSANAPQTHARWRAARQLRKNKMVVVVGQRCLVYGVVFLNTFIWTSISMIIHNKEPPKWNSFWLGCLAFLFMPLQGFFASLIYLQPRYKQMRKRHRGSRTRLYTLSQVIFSPDD